MSNPAEARGTEGCQTEYSRRNSTESFGIEFTSVTIRQSACSNRGKSRLISGQANAEADSLRSAWKSGNDFASMSIPRLLGVGVGLMLSFFALLYLLFSMGLYLNEPGVSNRALKVAFACLPLLVAVVLVYACFATGEISAVRALCYTVVAELLGFLVGFLLLAAFVYLKREPQVVLEEPAPIVVQSTYFVDEPQFPLPFEAVGVELPDGKFRPIMLLAGRVPFTNSKKPLLAADPKAGVPKLKVYRGTNELAAANHFLGEFQVSGYSRTRQSLQLMIHFDVDPKHRLLLKVRDVSATHNTALKLKRISAP